jgi:hypothetical protein
LTQGAGGFSGAPTPTAYCLNPSMTYNQAMHTISETEIFQRYADQV